MRVGLALPHYDFSLPGGEPISFARVAEVATTAERLGFAPGTRQLVELGDAARAGACVVVLHGKPVERDGVDPGARRAGRGYASRGPPSQ